MFISTIRQLQEKGYTYVSDPNEVKLYLNLLHCDLEYDVLLVKVEGMDIVNAWGGCRGFQAFAR